MSPTAAEWAWVAGIVEGEGTIQFTGKTSVRVVVAMTDRDVIETLDRTFPTPNGVRKWQGADPTVQARYEWTVGRRDDVLHLFIGIGPWMHDRRAERIRIARARLKLNRGGRAIRTHCPSGHPLVDENLYVTPNGWRQCKICRGVHRRKIVAA